MLSLKKKKKEKKRHSTSLIMRKTGIKSVKDALKEPEIKDIVTRLSKHKDLCVI